MSTATARDEELIPGSTLTRADLRRVNDELMLRQRQAEATAYVRQRSRVQSPETRKRISAKVAAYRKAQALAADYISPLRQARLDAGYTQSDLSARSTVDLSVIQRAETGRAERVSPRSLLRLGRCLGVEPEALADGRPGV